VLVLFGTAVYLSFSLSDPGCGRGRGRGLCFVGSSMSAVVAAAVAVDVGALRGGAFESSRFMGAIVDVR
jgi:hypothetical protein